MPDLTLLVLTDIHFRQLEEGLSPTTQKQCLLAGEFVHRAIRDARRRGGFDAVVFLGDLADTGDPADMAALEEVLQSAAGDVPRVIVSGNHDRDADLTLSVFADKPGLHEVKGYRLYTFRDRWDEKEVCQRPAGEMERFDREVKKDSGKPLIVLQHNVLHPPIDDPYPYIISDHKAIMQAYADVGVTLSLSGHFHTGKPLCEVRGVKYFTAPCLSEPPFKYTFVRLDGRAVSTEEHQLRLPDDLPLYDVHTHTHYAYCGEDVTPEKVIKRARILRLAGVCVTEHSDQLYLSRREHAAGRVYDDAGYWCAPRSEESNRMPRYRAEVAHLRDDFVKLGLEIELDLKGRPALRAEDRDGWDLLLGAVHWMPGEGKLRVAEEASRQFILDTTRLIKAGIGVLAHPFRFFLRNGIEPPRDLYRPLARMLAEHGVAAEINFHTNRPDPEFFAICIEEGVKIALGSDSHNLLEVADFYPHLALLREAAGKEDVAGLIYSHPWRQ